MSKTKKGLYGCVQNEHLARPGDSCRLSTRAQLTCSPGLCQTTGRLAQKGPCFYGGLLTWRTPRSLHPHQNGKQSNSYMHAAMQVAVRIVDSQDHLRHTLEASVKTPGSSTPRITASECRLIPLYISSF